MNMSSIALCGMKRKCDNVSHQSKTKQLKISNIRKLERQINPGHEHEKQAKINAIKHISIHEAVEQGRLGIVKQHLENRVQPNIFDRQNRTPLYYAIKYNNKTIVELLLKYGANHCLKSGTTSDLFFI